jgi:hypothetical protein
MLTVAGPLCRSSRAVEGGAVLTEEGRTTPRALALAGRRVGERYSERLLQEKTHRGSGRGRQRGRQRGSGDGPAGVFARRRVAT